MSEERKRSVAPWIAGVGLTLVLYVGSFGPSWAVAVHRSGPFPQWFDTLYAPVHAVTDRWGFTQNIMFDYGEFWHRIIYGPDKVSEPTP